MYSIGSLYSSPWDLKKALLEEFPKGVIENYGSIKKMWYLDFIELFNILFVAKENQNFVSMVLAGIQFAVLEQKPQQNVEEAE